MSGQRAFGRRALCKWMGLLGAGLIGGGSLNAVADAPIRGTRQAHLLIRNATVLTMDPTLGDIVRGDVLIRDGEILQVGTLGDIPGAEVIDASGMILIPGLVDAHWHMWNSLARNRAPSETETMFKAMSALSQRFTPQLTNLGVRQSLALAINSGITTVNNWAHNIRNPAFADAEWQAMQASGVRGRFWHGYPQDAAATDRMDFQDIERLQRNLEKTPGSLIDQRTRQTPSFRWGKDSVAGKAGLVFSVSPDFRCTA